MQVIFQMLEILVLTRQIIRHYLELFQDQVPLINLVLEINFTGTNTFDGTINIAGGTLFVGGSSDGSNKITRDIIVKEVH